MAKIEPHFETIIEGLLRLVNAFFGSLKNAIFWAPYLGTFAAYLGFSSNRDTDQGDGGDTGLRHIFDTPTAP